ncbi:hypothetical protein B0H10DRAFT_1957011 [Mycena sp. CBHHK59/15]|nr:hypothetical protein B0H10DRAFT_1957011 [Mycena sp. CBHHK59/15]
MADNAADGNNQSKCRVPWAVEEQNSFEMHDRELPVSGISVLAKKLSGQYIQTDSDDPVETVMKLVPKRVAMENSGLEKDTATRISPGVQLPFNRLKVTEDK